MATPRTRSGLQFAPDLQNVAWELCFGNTKSTKWLTVGSGHSKCCLGMVFWEHEEHEVAYSWLQAFKMPPGIVFWEHEEHEVAYSWLRAFKMWPGNGVLARWAMILGKSYTLFEVTIFSVLAWLHRNDDESHEV